jgi:hypothetical protein
MFGIYLICAYFLTHFEIDRDLYYNEGLKDEAHQYILSRLSKPVMLESKECEIDVRKFFVVVVFF